MIVTINGTIASGKSAVGKALADSLGYEYFSTGQIYREEADKAGRSVKEYLDYCDFHPEIHRELDKKVKDYIKGRDNIIIDGRVAWSAFPESLKLYLHCSNEIAALRIYGAERTAQDTSSLTACLEDVKSRHKKEREQFLDIYGKDIHDMRNYDLCIKTDNRSIEELMRFCQMAVAMFQVAE